MSPRNSIQEESGRLDPLKHITTFKKLNIGFSLIPRSWLKQKAAGEDAAAAVSKKACVGLRRLNSVPPRKRNRKRKSLGRASLNLRYALSGDNLLAYERTIRCIYAPIRPYATFTTSASRFSEWASSEKLCQDILQTAFCASILEHGQVWEQLTKMNHDPAYEDLYLQQMSLAFRNADFENEADFERYINEEHAEIDRLMNSLKLEADEPYVCSLTMKINQIKILRFNKGVSTNLYFEIEIVPKHLPKLHRAPAITSSSARRGGGGGSVVSSTTHNRIVFKSKTKQFISDNNNNNYCSSTISWSATNNNNNSSSSSNNSVRHSSIASTISAGSADNSNNSNDDDDDDDEEDDCFTAQVYSPEEDVVISVYKPNKGISSLLSSNTKVAQCVIPLNSVLNNSESPTVGYQFQRKGILWSYQQPLNGMVFQLMDPTGASSTPIGTCTLDFRVSFRQRRKIKIPESIHVDGDSVAANEVSVVRSYAILLNRFMSNLDVNEDGGALPLICAEEAYILSEFATRFRINDIKQQLALLKCYCSRSDLFLHLETIYALLKSLQRRFTPSSSSADITEPVSSSAIAPLDRQRHLLEVISCKIRLNPTRTEKKLFKETVVELLGEMEKIMSDFKTFFRPQPPGDDFKCALEIIQFILRHHDDLQFDFTKCIKAAINTDYMHFVEENFEEGLNNCGSNYKDVSTLFGLLVYKIENEDLNFFSGHFDTIADVHYMRKCLEIYYGLVTREIMRLDLSPNKADVVVKEVIEFCMELKKFNDFVKPLATDARCNIDYIQAGAIAKPFVQVWIRDTAAKLKEWSNQAVAMEKWTPIDPPQVLHSTSIVDIFAMFDQALSFMVDVDQMKTIDTNNNNKEQIASFMPIFMRSLTNVIIDYTHHIHQLCINDVTSAVDQQQQQQQESLGGELLKIFDLSKFAFWRKKGDEEEDTIRSFTLPDAFFVRINDIEAARQQLNIVIEQEIENKKNEFFQEEAFMNDDGDEDEDDDDSCEAGSITSSSSSSSSSATINSPSYGHQIADLEAIYKDAFKRLHMDLDELTLIIAMKIKDSISDALAWILEIVPQAGSSEDSLWNLYGIIGSPSEKRTATTKTKSEILQMYGEKLEEKLANIIEFLNEQLTTFSKLLYPDLFIKLLTKIYGVLMRSIEDMLLFGFSQASLNVYHIYILQEALEHFNKFFAADGEGLSPARIKIESKLVCQLFSAFTESTERLMKMFYEVTPSSPLKEIHILQILTGRKDDKQAQAFVYEKKSITESRRICEFFGLPETEQLINTHGCANSKLIFGNLYITSQHLCFAATTSVFSTASSQMKKAIKERKKKHKKKSKKNKANSSSSSSSKSKSSSVIEKVLDTELLVVIGYNEISHLGLTSLAKASIYGLGIVVTLHNKKSFTFAHLRHRNVAYKEILYMAAKAGVVLEDEFKTGNSSIGSSLNKIGIDLSLTGGNPFMTESKMRKLKKRLGIPAEQEQKEDLIDSFSCTDEKLSPGQLYVFSSYLGFEPSMMSWLAWSKPILIPLQEITQVKKEHFINNLKQLSISIVDSKGSYYCFCCFINRNSAFTTILAQAEVKGVELIGNDELRVRKDIAKTLFSPYELKSFEHQRQNEAMLSPAQLVKHFALPEDQKFIERFRCVRAQGGFLYIFTSYICFDAIEANNSNNSNNSNSNNDDTETEAEDGDGGIAYGGGNNVDDYDELSDSSFISSDSSSPAAAAAVGTQLVIHFDDISRIVPNTRRRIIKLKLKDGRKIHFRQLLNTEKAHKAICMQIGVYNKNSGKDHHRQGSSFDLLHNGFSLGGIHIPGIQSGTSTDNITVKPSKKAVVTKSDEAAFRELLQAQAGSLMRNNKPEKLQSVHTARHNLAITGKLYIANTVIFFEASKLLSSIIGKKHIICINIQDIASLRGSKGWSSINGGGFHGLLIRTIEGEEIAFSDVSAHTCAFTTILQSAKALGVSIEH